MYNEHMKQQLAQLSENPKVQGFWATWATTSGILTLLEYIPVVLGVPSMMMGMVLTWSMISKVGLDIKKTKMEIKLMEKEHVCKNCIDNRRTELNK